MPSLNEKGRLSISANDMVTYNKQTILDESWVKDTFLTPPKSLDKKGANAAITASADSKSLHPGAGRHISVNMPYAFTPYADAPAPGRLNSNKFLTVNGSLDDVGIGPYYGNAIEDNNSSRLLFLQHGVPKFTPAISFYLRGMDYPASIVANEGRYPFMYNIAKGVTTVAVVALLPFYRGLAFLALTAVGGVLPLMASKDYYRMKPTPLQFIDTAQSIVNSLSTERGVIGVGKGAPKFDKNRTGGGITFNSDTTKGLAKAYPTLFTDYGVNLYGMLTGAQTRLNKEIIEEAKNGNFIFSSNRVVQSGKESVKRYKALMDATMSIKENTAPRTPDKAGEGNKQPITAGKQPEEFNKPTKSGYAALNGEKQNTVLNQIAEGISAKVTDGINYTVLYVDYCGSISDTFTNNTKDVPVKAAFDGMSGAARDLRFTVSGGNFIGDAVNGMKQQISDTVAGALSGATMGFTDLLAGIADGSRVNFPKMWADSGMELASHTFKIRLGGPYGNKISQVLDIDVPLSLILASALPQSTGLGGYTSPYLISAFIRGVCNIEMGMITSLTITRGNGNLGFTHDGRPTNLEVSFTITDFANVMPAPTNTHAIKGAILETFNQDNELGRYLHTIVGRDIRTNSLLVPKLKLATNKIAANFAATLSGRSIGLELGDTLIGDIIGTFSPDYSAATIASKQNRL